LTETAVPDANVTQPRGFLPADFLLDGDRVSGQVNIRARSLFEQLDDATSSFLEVRDAYLSPILHPSELTAGYPAITLRKTGIHLVVLARLEDGLSRRQAYSGYLGNVPHAVLLITSRYHVQGRIILPQKMPLQAVLATDAARFVTVADATASLVQNAEVHFSGGAILVNTGHVIAFCETSEVKGPAK
jgi:hypothetical protein